MGLASGRRLRLLGARQSGAVAPSIAAWAPGRTRLRCWGCEVSAEPASTWDGGVDLCPWPALALAVGGRLEPQPFFLQILGSGPCSCHEVPGLRAGVAPRAGGQGSCRRQWPQGHARAAGGCVGPARTPHAREGPRLARGSCSRPAQAPAWPCPEPEAHSPTRLRKGLGGSTGPPWGPGAGVRGAPAVLPGAAPCSSHRLALSLSPPLVSLCRWV